MTVSGGETSSLSLSNPEASSLVGNGPGVMLGSSSVSSSSTAVVAQSGSSSVPCVSGVSSNGNVSSVAAAVSMKTKQEIQTSLHLIKDIRRLENYQRDFFLKVKESLSAVQSLLEHQLMDMTWSESLIQCEENLLESALQLSNVSPAQVSEIYGSLIRDRESLNRRFSELVSKSSLSEFIVNSGQILDINTVREATEAILKHEKPIRPKQDKSVPIDHTFFLANFCVSSLASGMMFRQSSMGSSKLIGVEQHPGHMHPQQVQHQHDHHLHQQPPQIHHQLPPPVVVGGPKKGVYAGSGSSDYVLVNGTESSNSTVPSSSSGSYGNGGKVVPSLMDAVYYKSAASSAGVPAGSSSDFSASAEAFVPSGGTSDFSGSSMYGQELVSAITQIAFQEDHTGGPSKKPSSASVANSVASSAQPPKGPWQKDPLVVVDTSSHSDNYFVGGGNGFPPDLAGISGSNGTAVEVSSSDTVSNSSSADEGRVSSGDVAKPLSFARIASLNLEKQQRLGASMGPLVSPNGLGSAASGLLSNLAQGGPGGGYFDRSVAAQVVAVAVQQQQQQQQQHQHHQSSLLLPPPLPASLNPRFFLDIVMEGKKLGRVIIEVEPLVAPKMSQNFQMLVTGEKGFGYRGCQFFQAWKNESVICGDWEHNSGRGGRAAFEGGTLFTPDDTKLPCVRGAVGMRRMSKKHSTLNQVASQFRIILANMHTQFSGIFGHVVSGIEALDKVANVGGEGGRPEKIASVQNCGIYKQQ